jgi:hypothetical protein
MADPLERPRGTAEALHEPNPVALTPQAEMPVSALTPTVRALSFDNEPRSLNAIIGRYSIPEVKQAAFRRAMSRERDKHGGNPMYEGVIKMTDRRAREPLYLWRESFFRHVIAEYAPAGTCASSAH